ncbi:MAG: TadE/TadG family type IV pilus assembly protein [Bacillota bacterium]|nr:TadE/TadG family type IV pilus assembly protein [Bacillota bacterium]
MNRPAGRAHGGGGGERGQATVEFTLVLALLVVLLVAIVDFGAVLNAQLVVAEAARTGGRRAAIDGGASPGAYQVVREQLEAGGLDPARARIEIWPRHATYGTLVHVRVETERQLHHPLTRIAGRGSLPLKSETISRSERLGDRAGEPW